jgi:hypothetical protein
VAATGAVLAAANRWLGPGLPSRRDFADRAFPDYLRDNVPADGWDWHEVLAGSGTDDARERAAKRLAGVTAAGYPGLAPTSAGWALWFLAVCLLLLAAGVAMTVSVAPPPPEARAPAARPPPGRWPVPPLAAVLGLVAAALLAATPLVPRSLNPSPAGPHPPRRLPVPFPTPSGRRELLVGQIALALAGLLLGAGVLFATAVGWLPLTVRLAAVTAAAATIALPLVWAAWPKAGRRGGGWGDGPVVAGLAVTVLLAAGFGLAAPDAVAPAAADRLLAADAAAPLRPEARHRFEQPPAYRLMLADFDRNLDQLLLAAEFAEGRLATAGLDPFAAATRGRLEARGLVPRPGDRPPVERLRVPAGDTAAAKAQLAGLRQKVGDWFAAAPARRLFFAGWEPLLLTTLEQVEVVDDTPNDLAHFRERVDQLQAGGTRGDVSGRWAAVTEALPKAFDVSQGQADHVGLFVRCVLRVEQSAVGQWNEHERRKAAAPKPPMIQPVVPNPADQLPGQPTAEAAALRTSLAGLAGSVDKLDLRRAFPLEGTTTQAVLVKLKDTIAWIRTVNAPLPTESAFPGRRAEFLAVLQTLDSPDMVKRLEAAALDPTAAAAWATCGKLLAGGYTAEVTEADVGPACEDLERATTAAAMHANLAHHFRYSQDWLNGGARAVREAARAADPAKLTAESKRLVKERLDRLAAAVTDGQKPWTYQEVLQRVRVACETELMQAAPLQLKDGRKTNVRDELERRWVERFVTTPAGSKYPEVHPQNPGQDEPYALRQAQQVVAEVVKLWCMSEATEWRGRVAAAARPEGRPRVNALFAESSYWGQKGYLVPLALLLKQEVDYTARLLEVRSGDGREAAAVTEAVEMANQYVAALEVIGSPAGDPTAAQIRRAAVWFGVEHAGEGGVSWRVLQGAAAVKEGKVTTADGQAVPLPDLSDAGLERVRTTKPLPPALTAVVGGASGGGPPPRPPDE